MVKKQKNNVFVFSNQKGGVGKSTLCALFANYLAARNFDVCVIDVDFQQTIFKKRERDKALIEEKGMSIPYNVYSYNNIDNIKGVESLMTKINNEISGTTLIDTPGNITEDGLIAILANCDGIICPFDYTETCLDSTFKFGNLWKMAKAKYRGIRAEMVFVPNRIDKREGTKSDWELWNKCDEVLRNVGDITPKIFSKKTMKTFNTHELDAVQATEVQPAFDYIIKKFYK